MATFKSQISFCCVSETDCTDKGWSVLGAIDEGTFDSELFDIAGDKSVSVD